MIIEGEHATAEVKLPESAVDDDLRAEIQAQVNAPAFRNDVTYMPDCHGGIGPHAIVGFSMPLGDRVVPNTVGGDIGCGMTAARLGAVSRDLEDDAVRRAADRDVREAVPMGFGTVRESFHREFDADFPWDEADEKLRRLFDRRAACREALDHDRYDAAYFEELCRRVGVSNEYVERSLGTLGSGNHFVEVSRSEQTGEYWVVVHSGSRNLGQQVKGYWQETATVYLDGEAKYDRLPTDLKPYCREDGTVLPEKIRADFEGKAIERTFDELKSVQPNTDRNKNLDYLEGSEMFGYLRDMIFTQTYATFNRRLIVEGVAECLDAEILERTDSPHNYVDFEDGVVRKGSTRAGDDERLVIPMNMKDGSLLCVGKGNDEWNESAPHGAGRLGSRGWAREAFDADEVKAELQSAGIYSSHVPGDEVPDAYKSTELIETQIEPTAEIVDRLEPVMNFKG